jgi:hypothetical protein
MPEDWRALLIEAAREDQRVRTELARSGALFNGYHPEMERVHLANADLLERAIAAIGWPTRSRVHDDGAGAAFMIAQHAISRPDLQRRALDYVLEAIPLGEANPLDAAYLSDRIAVFEGRGQIFGTQFDWNADGLLAPSPIADSANVEDRRASVGLPPLADTIAEMRANAAAEGEGAPADLAQRRADFEAWARRVGWRD